MPEDLRRIPGASVTRQSVVDRELGDELRRLAQKDIHSSGMLVTGEHKSPTALTQPTEILSLQNSTETQALLVRVSQLLARVDALFKKVITFWQEDDIAYCWDMKTLMLMYSNQVNRIKRERKYGGTVAAELRAIETELETLRCTMVKFLRSKDSEPHAKRVATIFFAMIMVISVVIGGVCMLALGGDDNIILSLIGGVVAGVVSFKCLSWITNAIYHHLFPDG